jgi:excisionase family DNA binding protein
MTLDDAPELLTVDEFRRIARVGRNQVYAAVRDGEIPALRIRGAIRIPKRALLKMLEDGPERDATPGDEPGVAEVMPQATIDQKATR